MIARRDRRVFPNRGKIMKFIRISGAVLQKLVSAEEIRELRTAGVGDDSEIRINQQGDIEILQGGTWGVIGGLLGDYQGRIKKLTGLEWT
jgi:hypothetical protein